MRASRKDSDSMTNEERRIAEASEGMWSCKACGPHPGSRATWCAKGCGSDYQEMTWQPKREPQPMRRRMDDDELAELRQWVADDPDDERQSIGQLIDRIDEAVARLDRAEAVVEAAEAVRKHMGHENESYETVWAKPFQQMWDALDAWHTGGGE